ncbi:hypothetical protein [Frigidibacter sp. MR17.24]|uniref:hypothetical protein n=1 Tax=Frigidibacter sp. MR17.24 TaxID=3127345 RepID=UPI003012E6B0
MRPDETIKRFRDREDGAVTVDWIVISAVAVGLAMVAATLISSPLNGIASDAIVNATEHFSTTAATAGVE